ncbi:MAG: Heat shock protein Hsp20 [Chloroflexi bacterium]|jgi:HSP20 family protein|nr:Heat shock protein Hsp20 [Chloroflexota bacterium]
MNQQESATQQSNAAQQGSTAQQSNAIQQRNDNQQMTSSPGTGMQRRDDQGMRRWDPSEIFDDMQQQMMRLWNQFTPVGWPPSRALRQAQQVGALWTPTVDVYDEGNELVVKAELPGVKKEDIDIALEEGNLVIRGQRSSEREVRTEQYYRSERSFGSFYRRIPVPEGVQPDQIKANFNDGVLEVRLPKPQESEAKRLKIEVK